MNFSAVWFYCRPPTNIHHRSSESNANMCRHHSVFLYGVILSCSYPINTHSCAHTSPHFSTVLFLWSHPTNSQQADPQKPAPVCAHTILYFSAVLFYSHHTDTHSKSSESCVNLCTRHSVYFSTVWFCCRDPMNSHSRSLESCANLSRHHSVFLHGVILYCSYPINTLSCAHTILHFSTALFFCSHLTNTDRSSESCASLCTRHSRKHWYLTSTLWLQSVHNKETMWAWLQTVN